MKKIFIYLCFFSFIFHILVFNVYADDYTFFDEWLDSYDESHPDNVNDFDNFATDVMRYEGIVINPSSKDSFMDIFTDYVVSNIPSGSSYLSSVQEGVDAFKNGSISANAFVSFLDDLCAYSGLNFQQIIKDTANDVSNNKGYELVPCFPYSKLSATYIGSWGNLDFVTGGSANFVLSYVGGNTAGSPSYYNTTYYSSELKDMNFLFLDSQFYTSSNKNYYKTLYNIAVSKDIDALWRDGRWNPPDVFFTADDTREKSFDIYFYGGSSVSATRIAYGMGVVNGANDTRFSMIVYTNESYAFIPAFYNLSSLNKYLTGQQPFYTSDMLKDLKLNDDFDYARLQQIIFDGIENGDFVTAIDLQAIINDSVTGYLQQININTKDILLSIQLGLLDNINNEPYLKQIRDLQIINNDKLDILIDLIRNGGIGSGGSGSSVNLDEISRRLDTIIDILNKPNLPPIDLTPDDPELPNFSVLLMDKFPFSIPYDISLMVSILGVEPVKPDIQIGFPIMGSDEVFLTSLDLSWFDEIRPLLFWFIDFGYLIFLLMLSLKIMEGVRR